MLAKSSFPLLLLNMFLAMLSTGIVIPILPELLNEFGAGGQAAGYLVSCFGLTQFIFSPIAGNLSDKYGRKPMILAGLFLFALSNLIAAVAGDLSLLFLSRLIGGIGSAALVPSIMAYVADITTNDQRGKAMSLLGTAMTSGFIIGPGAGGLLAELGIRFPFYASVGIGLLAMLCSLKLLPESTTADQRLMQRESKNKKENILRQIILSVRSKYFILLLMVFALTFGLMHFEAIFPLFVVQSYGFDTRDIAVLLTVCSLIATVNQLVLTGKLTRWMGEKKVISSMLVLCAVSLVCLLLSGNFIYVMFMTMLFFTFNNILRPTLNTLLSKEAGDEQGFVAGLNNAYMSLGNIFGPGLAGILFDIHINLPYLFGACVLVVSSVIAATQIGKKRAAVRNQSIV
ncbi:MFS transporter [Paenibacillus sp. 32352]|uniref:MFS transporter n=1 Tax=Paenibacillus sp. 32352 TaxID=1969111 RepID=UPI0009ACE05A|nr:MFS transporter [Paenibacillus sp. 32352]